MDIALLSSNKKLELIERREVKAGRIGQGNILDLKGFILLLFWYEFKLIDLLTLEEVFHGEPI